MWEFYFWAFGFPTIEQPVSTDQFGILKNGFLPGKIELWRSVCKTLKFVRLVHLGFGDVILEFTLF